MRAGTRRLLVACVTTATLVLSASVASASATLDGRSDGHDDLAVLTARWWQWSIAIPAPGHPFSDSPTHDCTYAQNDPVWFLGGVVNATGVTTRDCRVPEGTLLLIPALNVECSSVESPPFFGAHPAQQRECVRLFKMADLFVTLDGRAVPMRYIESPPFRFRAPAGNILGVPGPVNGSSVSAGWWSLVRVPRGDHVLRFGGSFPDFGVTLDITYNLHGTQH
jgi:hypothetical protein